MTIAAVERCHCCGRALNQTNVNIAPQRQTLSSSSSPLLTLFLLSSHPPLGISRYPFPLFQTLVLTPTPTTLLPLPLLPLCSPPRPPRPPAPTRALASSNHLPTLFLLSAVLTWSSLFSPPPFDNWTPCKYIYLLDAYLCPLPPPPKHGSDSF